MHSDFSLLKLILVRRWKTPKLICIFSFLFNNSCSHPSFAQERLDVSISHFHNSTKHIMSTTYKLPWVRPPYFTSSTHKFESRSFVTRESTEEEEVVFQVLDEITSELKKRPSSVKKLCTNHIIEFCKKRKLRAAAKLLQLLREKHSVNNLPAYNILLAAACENNDTQIASRVFKDMLVNHLLINSMTYLNVAKAISKSNDLTFVQFFVKEISELISTESVTVINRIIYAFAECGHVYNAMLVFDHMKSLKFKPDLVTYNTVLGILGKAGRVDEMLDVFASMRNVDIAPDIYSYNTLLHSLRRVGRFDICVVLTKEMGKVGLRPDVITYSALIECFFKSGNIEESLRLFEDMKCGGVRPSIYIYRSLINNLKKLGKPELALKFLQEMNECLEDLVGPQDFKKKSR